MSNQTEDFRDAISVWVIILPCRKKMQMIEACCNHFSIYRLPFFRVLYHLMDLWYNKEPISEAAGPAGGKGGKACTAIRSKCGETWADSS